MRCWIDSQTARRFMGGICLFILSGCGQATDRRALEGSVTLDKAPLADGNIGFFPQSGTGGPAAGGKIKEGRFLIDRDKGAYSGTFRVEITAARKTGKKVKTPLGDMIDGYEQYLSERYNRSSELTAEVTEDGPNQFEFALMSK